MLSFDRHVYLCSSHLRKTMALVLHNTDNANVVIPLIHAEVLAGILYVLCYEKSYQPVFLPSSLPPPAPVEVMGHFSQFWGVFLHCGVDF